MRMLPLDKRMENQSRRLQHGSIAKFLRAPPEEEITANADSLCLILEFRNALTSRREP